MRLTFVLAPLAAALLLLPSCGRSHESVLEDMTGKLEQLAKVVDACKTAEDAKAMERELRALGEDLRAIAEEAKELDKPSEEEGKDLEKKFGPRLIAARARLEAAGKRLLGEQEVDRLIQDALRVSR